MVASTITILPIYLDCEEFLAMSGGVTTLEDDSIAHESDSKTVSTTERSDRVLQTWQLTWRDHESEDARFIWELFRVCRNSRGFIFISPHVDDRVATGQRLRNTVTGSLVGDGTTTTFQLLYAVTLDYDVGPPGSASSDYADVNYPLNGTVVAYKDGAAATLSSINYLTGVVTFTTAPGVGVVPTADYERGIAARITSQSIARTLQEGSNSEVRSLQIKEVP